MNWVADSTGRPGRPHAVASREKVDTVALCGERLSTAHTRFVFNPAPNAQCKACKPLVKAEMARRLAARSA